MNLKRKYQVFISSTYTDLIAERQAAVSAILAAGHIPAGMELFTAGDVSQMVTIQKWISNCDLFLLILGGRYGSIEPITQKSYVELEYQYAVDNGIPYFALVAKKEHLDRKVKEYGIDVMELHYPEKLREFREKVLTRISLFYDDLKDIEISIHRSIASLVDERDLIGWVRADSVLGLNKIESLQQEIKDSLNRYLQEYSRRMTAETQVRTIRDSLPLRMLESLQKIHKELAEKEIDLNSEDVRTLIFSKLLVELTPVVQESKQID